jgi:hypothetical protein
MAQPYIIIDDNVLKLRLYLKFPKIYLPFKTFKRVFDHFWCAYKYGHDSLKHNNNGERKTLKIIYDKMKS